MIIFECQIVASIDLYARIYIDFDYYVIKSSSFTGKYLNGTRSPKVS